MVNKNLKISLDELKSTNNEISAKVDDLAEILNELKTNRITKTEFEKFKTEVMEAKKKELAKSRLENSRLRNQLRKIRLQRSKKSRSPYCPR